MPSESGRPVAGSVNSVGPFPEGLAGRTIVVDAAVPPEAYPGSGKAERSHEPATADDGGEKKKKKRKRKGKAVSFVIGQPAARSR